MKKRDRPEGFNSAESIAEEFVRDKEKTLHLLNEAVAKAERLGGKIRTTWQDIQALIRLVRAWIKGEYDQVPWKTIVLAIAGIVYFVNPFDAVPDFIPGAGLLDDATVIGFVIKAIRTDIEQFLLWERSREEPGL